MEMENEDGMQQSPADAGLDMVTIGFFTMMGICSAIMLIILGYTWIGVLVLIQAILFALFGIIVTKHNKEF